MFVLNFVRDFQEAPAVADAASLGIETIKADSAGFNDVINIVVSLAVALADAADAIDVLTLVYGLAPSDSPALADQITQKDFSKVVTETLFGTDDLDGASGVDDDQTMTFVKVRTDLGFLNDNVVNLTSKIVQDTPSADDSGSLTTQTYALEDYFAEEYCGFIRTF